MTTDAAAAAAAGAGEGSLGGLDKVETFPVPPPAEAEAPPSSSSSAAYALLASRVSVLLGIDKPMQIKDGLTEEENGKEGDHDDDDDDDGSFDLVLGHLTAEAFSDAANNADADEKIDASSQRALSFADAFLKHVRSAPGALDDRGDDALLVVVVFSGGGGGGDGEELPLLSLPLPPRGGAPLPLLPEGCSSCHPVPRPAQSFEFAEGCRMEEPPRRGSERGGGGAALLVASRCDGVLRADGARRLLECKRRKSGERSESGHGKDNFEVLPGGNGMGCVLAEHLLDEVAYKIGRALKYGA